MKWISPVDCSASYLNRCFRLLIYIFNPSVPLLPIAIFSESLKIYLTYCKKVGFLFFFWLLFEDGGETELE